MSAGDPLMTSWLRGDFHWASARERGGGGVEAVE